jgi:2-amino-4-hydroxy-6-hydroxymethyldihydropteridine diphosphokinase
MGSNIQREAQLKAAREALRRLFPDIRFSDEMLTEAIGQGYLSPFSNQMARFTTALSAEEVHTLLKDLEHHAGRRPEDKAQGLVKLDADLLMYDGEVLKPEDLQRGYVKELMSENF